MLVRASRKCGQCQVHNGSARGAGPSPAVSRRIRRTRRYEPRQYHASQRNVRSGTYLYTRKRFATSRTAGCAAQFKAAAEVPPATANVGRLDCGCSHCAASGANHRFEFRRWPKSLAEFWKQGTSFWHPCKVLPKDFFLGTFLPPSELQSSSRIITGPPIP